MIHQVLPEDLQEALAVFESEREWLGGLDLAHTAGVLAPMVEEGTAIVLTAPGAGLIGYLTVEPFVGGVQAQTLAWRAATPQMAAALYRRFERWAKDAGARRVLVGVRKEIAAPGWTPRERLYERKVA